MALLPYAGDQAQAKAKPMAEAVRPGDVAWAVATGVLVLALAAATAPAALQAFALSAGGLLGMIAALRTWLRQRLGGYTGDALGACEQFGELVVLLAFSARWVA